MHCHRQDLLPLDFKQHTYFILGTSTRGIDCLIKIAFWRYASCEWAFWNSWQSLFCYTINIFLLNEWVFTCDHGIIKFLVVSCGLLLAFHGYIHLQCRQEMYQRGDGEQSGGTNISLLIVQMIIHHNMSILIFCIDILQMNSRPLLTSEMRSSKEQFPMRRENSIADCLTWSIHRRSDY